MKYFLVKLDKAELSKQSTNMPSSKKTAFASSHNRTKRPNQRMKNLEVSPRP